MRTQGRNLYYLNILGLGFVAKVTKMAHKLKFLGNISYTFSAILQMIFLENNSLRIELDGNIFEREAIFVEISNTRYTSNFLIAPDAKIDDGLLDVILLRKCSRSRLLRNFPKIFTGEHTALDEIETFQARKISITAEKPQLLAPDGELLGQTPVEVECLPGAVEMFWG
ncbi:MAG: diacylglycerol/lipid kinase family protein [bacterium]